MAAGNITFDIGITGNAADALKRIQNEVQRTQSAFGGLKAAIASIGFGALVTSALRYADSIQDIADATGIATQNVIGFSKAVQQNGGDADRAQAALVRFQMSIGEAAQGGLQAQDAFRQVGVTLNDLATLSEQEILKKTIDGLAKIEDRAKRSVLQNELLGKSLKGVNLAGVASMYGQMSAESAKYAESIRKAAELQDKMSAALGQFKMALIQALEPLINYLNNLKPEQIQKFIDAVIKIGGAAAGILALTKSFEALSKVVALFGGLFALYKTGLLNIAGGMATVGTAVTGLGKTFNWLKSSILGILSGAIPSEKALEVLGRRISWLIGSSAGIGALITGFGGLALGIGKVALAFAGVGAAVVGINDLIEMAFDINPIKSMGDWLERLVTEYIPPLAKALNWLGEKLGMAPGKLTDAGKAAEQNKVLTEQKKLQEQVADAAAKRAEQERIVKDALEKQRKEIQGLADDYKKTLDQTAEKLQMEIGLVGASEEQKSLTQALVDLRQKERDEIDKLQKAQAALTEEQKRGGLAEEYDKQINKVKELSAAEQERLTKLVAGLEAAKAAEAFRQYNIKQEYELQDKLKGLERERADLTLTDIEKKYRDIVRAAEDSAEAAIREENARRGVKMSLAEEQQYRDRALQGTKSLLEAQKRLYDQSRTFSTGWTKAFKEYVDNARNASKTAERLFEKFTSGIEDMLVNFAKTGKFTWKSFVADMLEELLRSQIKQVMASLLTLPNPFGGGSVGDMFGGLFGALTGGGQIGSTPTNPMYVVDISGGGAGGGMGGLMSGGGIGGAQGGGIFDTIGNIFSGVKNAVGGVVSGIGSTVGKVIGGVTDVVGNIGGALGSVVNGIGGAIGDVASGIGSVVNGIGGAIGDVASGIGSVFSGGSSGGGGFLSDIASGIGDMFSGWFANGGTIPQGKFGIVGERGPELVGGPASVTPLGGTTNVYYTIQAVDARSFQQLLAQDPSLIYALTEQGRKSIAGAR